MSTVKANTYQDASGGSNAVFSGVASPPNSMGFRNRIINGDMRIDQRNAGASVTPTATNTYTLDRFKVLISQASKFSVQQSSVAPAGFVNSALITSLAATSVAASDLFCFVQYIEGVNTADLGWGAAGASTVTLSFWVRSSLTGAFGGSLQNSAGNRCYPFSYTINSANTWEQKTVTIAGDTTGTWLTTSGIGIRVIFGLGVGSTYSGTAGAWTSSSDILAPTGSTSVVGTNGATWYITGVQLEAGTVASPFERRDYGRELMMCQRYYESMYNSNSTMASSGGFIALGVCENTTRVQPYFPFKVQKRTAPSTTLSAIGTFGMRSTAGSSTACTSGSFGASNVVYANGEFNTGSSVVTSGGCAWLTNHDGNAKIEWSAEL